MEEGKQDKEKRDLMGRIGFVVFAAGLLVSPMLIRLADSLWGRRTTGALGWSLCSFALLLVLSLCAIHIRKSRIVRAFSVIALLVLSASLILRLSVSTGPTVPAARFSAYLILSYLFYLAFRKTFQDLGTHLLGGLFCVGVGLGEQIIMRAVPWANSSFMDLIVVAAASVAGALLWGAILFPDELESRVRPRSWVRFLYCAAVIVLLTNALLSLTIMGHSIRDTRIGEFRSHYSRSKLERKQKSWNFSPPPKSLLKSTFTRFEDTYKKEAFHHVGERDRFMAQGDSLKAYKENLIIERYYTPVAVGHGVRLDARTAGELAEAAGEQSNTYYHLSGPQYIQAWLPEIASWFLAVIASLLLIIWGEFIRIKRGI